MVEWRDYIKNLLSLKEDNELDNYARVVVRLFQGLIYPEISLISTSSKTLYVPEQYYIKVEGGSKVFEIIKNPEIFQLLPFDIKRSFLDILYLIFRRGIYDIIRFQSNNFELSDTTLFGYLLRLIDINSSTYESICISKRVLLLLGVVGSVSVSTIDVKDLLYTLRYPSELTTSIIQCIHQLVKLDIAVLKAYPENIFSFGGFGSGLYSYKNTNLFTREYQFFTWFRVENFDRSIDQDDSLQHIFTMITTTSKGIDIFIEDKKLCMTIYHGKNEPIYKQFNDQILSRGVWYHLSIRHCKPRMAIFTRDEFSIYLDFQLLYQENIRYPSISNNELVDITCGKNFDGQMSAIYLLNESIPLPAVEVLARQDAGKLSDISKQSVDLQQSITLNDKKVVPILSKITTVYHPNRCFNDYALDIHSNSHGQLASKTTVWTIKSFNDLINSLGGLLCLLPLFPRLFIENELKRVEAVSNSQIVSTGGNSPKQSKGISVGLSGLGTSLGDINDNYNGYEYTILDSESIASLQCDRNDFITEGCLSYLFLLLSRCLTSNKYHQRQLIQIGGIDMIEYALRCISPSILLSEGESCVLAILQLRASVNDVVELDSVIVKRLLCNFEVWSKSSYQLQTSLMSVLVASMKAQPNYFLNLIGIQGLIDGMTDFYIDKMSMDNKSPTKPDLVSAVMSKPIEEESLMLPKDEATQSTQSLNYQANESAKLTPRVNFSLSSENLSSYSNSKSLIRSSSFKVTLNREILYDVELEESHLNNTRFSHGDSNDNDDNYENDYDNPNDGELDFNAQITIDTTKNDLDMTDIDVTPLSLSSEAFEASDYSLTCDQRKNLRECLQTMILTLALHGSSENEIKPILDFMSVCKDSIVLFELSQLLLCLIVEGNASMMASITLACKGPEEFATFVIFHLVHQSSEDVRSIGIRILTHYYLRLDCLPTNILNTTLKRRKGSILSRAIDTLSSGGTNSHSIQRLVICGGLTLLVDIVESHMKNSSELTYSALLEMLLTKPGSRSQISIKHTELFQSSTSPNDTPLASVNIPVTSNSSSNTTNKLLSTASLFLPTLYNSSILSRASSQSTNIQKNDKSSFTQRSVVFAAHYLSPDQVHDEGTSMVNIPILPLFFQLLPMIPVSVHDQIFSDLLALLKHSIGNRDAFCEHPLWHVCMYEMLSLLINHENIQISRSYDLHNNDIVKVLESCTTNNNKLFKDIELASPICLPSNNESVLDKNQLDTKFDIGMKVYATLLLHTIDKRGGWRELQRTVSQSYHTLVGYSIGQTVLSHVINELTFNIKSKYKDFQRLSNSINQNENNEAMNKLENTFTTILIASEYSLMQVSSVNIILNNINYDIGKNRLQHYEFLCNELAVPVTIISSDTKADNSSLLMKSWLNSTPLKMKSYDKSEEHNNINTNVNIPYDHSNIQSSMTAEANMILDMTEKNLIRNLQEIIKEEPNNVIVYNILEDKSNYIDFKYIWIDITNNLLQFLQNPTTHDKSKYLIQREQLLHPLDREHNIMHGRLVLILQTLRLFDVIFWPNENSSLRNSRMLRFQSEKQENNNKRDVNLAYNGTFSLYSGTMRMCLYVLSSLSPFTDLSILNLKRIKVLVDVIEKVSNQSTPIQDWIICIQTHVTTILQVITSSLSPFFQYLKLNSPKLIVPIINLNYKNDNTLVESEIIEERQNINNDERCFEECLNDNETSNILQNFFDNITGRQLIQYIKCCILILISIYDNYKSLLSLTFSEKIVFWLSHLIERCKADMRIQGPNVSSESISSKGNNSEQNPQKSRRRTISDISIIALESGGIARLNINKKNQSDTISETSSEFSENIRYENDIIYSSDTSFSYDLASPVDDRLFARDIVTILLWLREPYFKCNLLRSTNVVKSLISLENYESLCNQYYINELDTMETILHEQKNTNRKKVVNEIMELKELSGLVTSMMKSRELSRKSQHQMIETMRLKKIATNWQECIHKFEADWSPWVNTEYYDHPIQGKAYYELSRLKDTRMRRMILTTTIEPIDHSDAAYTDSKIRDQQNYEKSQSSDLNDNIIKSNDNSNEISFLKSDFNKIILKRESNTQAQVSTWDEDDDVIFDDDANNNNNNSSIPNNTSTLVGGSLAHFFSMQNIERPLWTYTFDWNAEDKIQMIIDDVTFIQVENVILGSLLLTSKYLYFHPIKMTGNFLSYNNVKDNSNISQYIYNDKRWSLDRLTEVYLRRYLLQNCAIELFFIDITEIYLAFKSLNQVKQFYNILKRQYLPLFTLHNTLNPKAIIRSLDQGQKYLDLWKRRQISNFEYLMYLNMISGRSYNDITQYPIMPWILSDYTSDTINLNNSSIYRDLSKPVGALNEQRLQEFLDRYHTFDDIRENGDIPKFMYGSHYSSAGVVLHYLIRQEPFTSMAINLQGGRFDCPDRIFFDISKTWLGCNNSMSDVKELIPELFCCPEVLLNTNSLMLGELQDGGVVNDVVLPPWSKNSIFEFIRIHREALESEYVSEHLNEWIDLIFGSKQRGKAAVEAYNVFYYLTYENAINIDAIEDPLQREATKAQVIHFGQTPYQLFNKDHPKRLPKNECMIPLCTDLTSLHNIIIYLPSKQFENIYEHGSIISIQCSSDRLVVVHSDLTISYYRWNSFPDGEGNPFQIRPDKQKILNSINLSTSLEILQKKLSNNNKIKLYNNSFQKLSTNIIDKITNDKTKNNNIFLTFAKRLGNSNNKINTYIDNDIEKNNSIKNINNIIDNEDNSQKIYNNTKIINNCLTRQHIALIVEDSGYSRIISCGYFDHSLKVHNLDTLREIGSISHPHLGQITCLQIGQQSDGITVITGGEDGTCRVWIVENNALANSYNDQTNKDLEYNSPEMALQCINVLWGHSTPIKTISYASDLDIVLSASSSGLLCVHTVRQGMYLRSIKLTLGQDVQIVLVTSAGYMIVYSVTKDNDFILHLFWINGEHLISKTLSIGIDSMAVNGAGNVLVCGLYNGTLCFLNLWNLEEIHRIQTLCSHGSIKSLKFTDDLQFLLIGSEDGTYSIATDPDLRWKMLHAAFQKTPFVVGT